MKRIYIAFILMVLFNTLLGVEFLYAQKNNSSNEGISLEKAIQLIEDKYKVSFSYSSDLIKLNKPIKLTLQNKSLNEALDQLATQAKIDYKINGKQIILIPLKKTVNDNFYIHGYIRDISTKEALPNILVYCAQTKTAVYTNAYGYYSLPVIDLLDTVELQAHIVGYKTNRKKVEVNGDVLLNWDLESSIQIEDIIIEDERIIDKAFHKSIISENIDDEIRALSPRLLGEKDALAATRYYAGVNRETDISSGYNIRGGRPDQNLIILDDAPLYHSFHLMGLYSIFNEDALKQMNLIKSGFPARYGGRLSSVVEMITKDGDMQNFHTDIGTGIIASRLGIEGPLIKNKVSFFLSGRSAHLNTLSKAFNIEEGFGYNFYDINAKVHWRINNKHKLFASFYSGNDLFDGGNEDGSSLINNTLTWGNQSATLRWNHIISSKWFANTTLLYSNYEFKSDQSDSALSLKFSSGVKDISFKYDIDYYFNDSHHFKFGTQITTHEFTPTNSISFNSTVPEEDIENFKTNEFAFYAEDEISISPKLSTNLGLRYSGFNYKDFVQMNLEPRALITYLLSKDFAIKASYGRMYQYAHYLNAFAGIGLPTDLWLPSTSVLLPEKSDQYTLGVYFNNKKNWKLNVEGFYKFQKGILSYSPNSSFFASIFKGSDSEDQSWEDRTMSGLAEIYGSEFQIEYQGKKYRSLIAYTISFNKNYFEELDYDGWFWANNDRRHNLSIMNSYRINKHWSAIATWVYTTGTPFTLPEASYYVDNHEPGNLSGGSFLGSSQLMAYDYKGINSYRVSSYHRLDISINYMKQFRACNFELQFGAMNVYNRKNTLYYTIAYNESSRMNELKRIAFLGIMPNVTLNFRF